MIKLKKQPNLYKKQPKVGRMQPVENNKIKLKEEKNE
jgi:hypothetical protein